MHFVQCASNGEQCFPNTTPVELLTDANPDIREEELDVSDEVPEIKSKLSFKEESEEVINRGQQQNRHQSLTEAQVIRLQKPQINF